MKHLIIIAIPIISIWFSLFYLKNRPLSIISKIGIAIIFTLFQFLSTSFAIMSYTSFLLSKGVNCVTSAVGYIPIGFILWLLGLITIVFLPKSKIA